MAMFAKKVDGDSKLGMEAAVVPLVPAPAGSRGYGIA